MNNAIVSNSTTSKDSQTLQFHSSGARSAAYTFLRHTGYILDELSVQGLLLWPDENGRWQWRWQGTNLQSTQGFWAMGEALVDAVNGRYPETFSIST